MTKFQLDVDYDFDFRLIGISCHAKDYRLCWALNNQLGLQLEKIHRENAASGLKKNGIAIESIYTYFDEENHSAYQLFYNKHNNNLLLPEQKLADFLLTIDQMNEASFEELMKEIKKIDLVNTAFVIDVNTLKSKENLIF
jgi:hypothetical protein